MFFSLDFGFLREGPKNPVFRNLAIFGILFKKFKQILNSVLISLCTMEHQRILPVCINNVFGFLNSKVEWGFALTYLFSF